MQFNTLPPEALAPIRDRFLVALRDRESRVQHAVATASTGEPAVLLDDIHKIRGVAPMLGMARLGALAADAEDRLEAWLNASFAPPRMPDDLQSCLRALHHAMREALD
ncbi:hypothetical protein HYN69_07500 [Gemmobacter aquarius]|uniref:HPt domain-containing protein n=1 Tax=Paragemmobacter aquarius TaxID=2169400 RepID=A0A2S0UKQ4_9RHOB|nr:Hpt domain-containing protein [Gemmobacter aquarius]AWB48382.1 hypothetical protein HYN69_07500 [Gemmobacter aquarius]